MQQIDSIVFICFSIGGKSAKEPGVESLRTRVPGFLSFRHSVRCPRGEVTRALSVERAKSSTLKGLAWTLSTLPHRFFTGILLALSRVRLPVWPAPSSPSPPQLLGVGKSPPTLGEPARRPVCLLSCSRAGKDMQLTFLGDGSCER